MCGSYFAPTKWNHHRTRTFLKKNVIRTFFFLSLRNLHVFLHRDVATILNKCNWWRRWTTGRANFININKKQICRPVYNIARAKKKSHRKEFTLRKISILAEKRETDDGAGANCRSKTKRPRKLVSCWMGCCANAKKKAMLTIFQP